MSKMKRSIALGLDPASLSFGMKVRYCRVCINMRAERLAILYAEAMGEEPYSGRRIEQMEHNDDFPINPWRRWAIASIVKMGIYFDLSTLGLDLSLPEEKQQEIKLQIRAGKFDLNGHQAFVKQIWTQEFPGTLEEVEGDILDRINDIDLKNSYVNAKRTKQARRTLDALHIVLATHVYGARNDAQAMIEETRLAALLARENGFSDLYATALLQLGVFFMDQGNYAAAFENFQAAKRGKRLPQQLRGKILASAGRAKMRMARTEEDKSEAEKLFDEAEGLTDKSTLDDFDFLVAFNNDKYLLERGEGLIGSPVKELRDPEKALTCLPVLYQVDTVSEELFRTVGHRQAHNHILQAEIAIEQGDYGLAVTLALAALDYTERLQSRVHPKKLVRIYNLLKQSPYCNDDKVVMLGIRLMRNLYPERFSKGYEG